MYYDAVVWLTWLMRWVSTIGVAVCQLAVLVLIGWALRTGRWRPKDAYEVAYLMIGLSASAYVFRALA